jgi:error-prone DNA polymerase
MAFNNPSWSWSELEATLSGKHGRDGRAPGSPSWNSGGDGPAWSRKRQPFEAPPELTGPARAPTVPYAELHCHSNFSFLDGASHPEELATEAARLGLEALAITDHDGFYGVVRFAEAAKAVGLPTVFGTEITLSGAGAASDAGIARTEADTVRQVATGRVPDSHAPDPSGTHLLVLADGPGGYARLSRALSNGHLAGEKGAPQFAFADVADTVAGHGWVLTGCRKGAVPAALVADGPAAARRELLRLVDAFGRDRVLVELWDHGDPLDSARNDALVELAHRERVECVATNNVHYATPSQRKLATALAAVRSRRSLDQVDAWLPAAAGAHLRSGAEQAKRFRRYPGVVERAAEIGRAAAFDLSLVAPKLPPFPCPVQPDGTALTEMQYLRLVTEEGARRRYGERPAHAEDLSLRARAWKTIDHELALIEQLDFAGYFLIVWDIVEFCRRSNIFCQGRGSAANSAVCYAIGITAADAVSLGLLFERFLSPERDGPPDIDVDIESDRREEVIQYVYERYGRHHTAQVANVITYRARSAVRDMAKALGFEPGQQDAWSKQVDGWGGVATTAAQPDCSIPEPVLELATGGRGCPAPSRHPFRRDGDLRPAGDRGVPGRVGADGQAVGAAVGQGRLRAAPTWSSSTCSGSGCSRRCTTPSTSCASTEGYEIDLATIPQDDDVYGMLCRADTVGVFQIESRAQMATLPRLKPRRFYDLVVEVALIRPGPIQGGSVHPYIRRRNGLEPVTYLHPLLERGAGQDARGAAVPGAADADGDRRRRVHAGRVRRAAPGDGLEAVGTADGAAEVAGCTPGWRATGSPVSSPTTFI